MKITQESAKALEVTDRDVWHWDDTLKGFAVRCRPGVPKAFWVWFRLPTGQSRKKNLGPIATVKVADARERARDLIAAARKGQDLIAEGRASRDAPTVLDLARRHQEEHKPPVISEKSAYDNESLWRLHIVPALGSRRVAEITHLEINKFHKRYDSGKRVTGNRAVQCLSKALSDCEVWGWRPMGSNPCKRVKRFEEKRRDVVLEPEEIARLLAVTQRLKREPVVGIARACPYLIELLLISGLRHREWSLAEWSWVDWKTSTIKLPRTKTDRLRVVQLAPEVMDRLREIPREEGVRWIIPNKFGTGGLKWPEESWELVKGLAKLDAGLNLHDLRHTWASYAHDKGGLSLKGVGSVLGHKTTRTTERYLNGRGRQEAEAAAVGARVIFEVIEGGRLKNGRT